MNQTKLYIPIENLNVEKNIVLGNVLVHPSIDSHKIIESFNKVTKKTKNSKEQKKKFAEWYANDIKEHLGRYAFAEISWDQTMTGKLIPDDLVPVYEKIKEVLAVLYLLQKDIVGVISIEHQKFGLKRDLYSSLNYVVGLDQEERSTYSMNREGVLGDWTFVNREIDKFPLNSIYIYFDRLLRRQNRNDIEKRILSAIIWLYDAALDFNPTNRFVKLAISLEVLFASGKNQKSFRLSKFSTLISHMYMFDNWKCMCPILDSNSAKEYESNIRKLKLPGMCSAYWDLRKWYQIRSDIVHDAERVIDKKELSSFEWWTHKLIIATVKIVSSKNLSTLNELEDYLIKEYKTFSAKT